MAHVYSSESTRAIKWQLRKNKALGDGGEIKYHAPSEDNVWFFGPVERNQQRS